MTLWLNHRSWKLWRIVVSHIVVIYTAKMARKDMPMRYGKSAGGVLGICVYCGFLWLLAAEFALSRSRIGSSAAGWRTADVVRDRIAPMAGRLGAVHRLRRRQQQIVRRAGFTSCRDTDGHAQWEDRVAHRKRVIVAC